MGIILNWRLLSCHSHFDNINFPTYKPLIFHFGEYLSSKFYEFLCTFQTLSCLNMFLDACKFCIPIEEDGFSIYSATLVVCTVVSFHLQTQRMCSFTPSYQHHPVCWAFVCLHLFARFSCRSLHSSWTCKPRNPTLISLVTPKTFHRLILYNTSTAFNMGAIWKILRHSPHCPCRPWQQLTYERHNLSQQHLFWWLIQLRAKRLEFFFLLSVYMDSSSPSPRWISAT